jgi:metal-responsive CopG/Arc/MetJ family transcriptional regulator
MRTTVELSDEIRAKLLELSARRGDKGFSALVEEALERYFDEHENRRRRADEARGVLGSMGEEDAEELRDSVERLRGRWR